MTQLLELAFAKASKLPDAEQELLAKRLLIELETDTEFDVAISQTGAQLTKHAKTALSEHRAGQTRPLDHEQI